MDLATYRDDLVDLVQESEEVGAAVLALAASDHLSRCDIERGKEVERSMAEVVVSPPLGLTEVHRQDRLRSLKRFDLGILVDGGHRTAVWRSHVQTRAVAHP